LLIVVLIAVGKRVDGGGQEKAKEGNQIEGDLGEDSRLTSGSGPSTYPANRDFKGHVGRVRRAAPQGFFSFFHFFPYFSIFFLLDFQGEKR
jgi:hypothetical protein